MNVLVDTCVWSYAFRKDQAIGARETGLLQRLIDQRDEIFITGIILQELLQGFTRPAQQKTIIDYFQMLPCIVPALGDYIAAAGIRNQCRIKGVPVETIDALLSQLCLANNILLLTSDKNFKRIAGVVPLQLL